ncbi:adenylate/guanylate cyclase domain-containing protein [Leadbettera azotonutricia]|uniref:Adenylate/guanylate cyclase n=1 Tax=Leadbettera azotonutricia (strain ATCC BAA-888 / DSM 13862 / ZAS-9) TaxID=545695 RepID=F5YE94_LEAAZ|nr:adenylate/guanylate cyclase domain-containing protein [Leadbettera azotonutricia]AEF81763.1 adenylate/guanylate cyclase [Leadbettera azotonutricia ZAS-9]
MTYSIVFFTAGFVACLILVIIFTAIRRVKTARKVGKPAPGPAVDAILLDPLDSQNINPFVPQAFLDILKKDSVNQLRLGDHVRQEMTIFFSDIRQFTSLMENLTPEESFKFINSYLARIVPVITANGGFVDKYIGDAILALYPQHNSADMAVRSAIEIQKTLVEYNQHRANFNYRPLSIGVGIHTGTLMMGVVGVEDRMQNTVISDAVNQASRLEGMCKAYNVSIVISEEIFKKLENPGSYMYRFLGKARVKGKAEPVSVFEIFDGINPDLLERKKKANRYWEEGMLSFSKKEYFAALKEFQRVKEILPDDGATYYYYDYCMKKL